MSDTLTTDLQVANQSSRNNKVFLLSNSGSTAQAYIADVKNRLTRGQSKNIKATQSGFGKGINALLWAHFTPAASPNSNATILQSYGISSIHMGASGTYTVNFLGGLPAEPGDTGGTCDSNYSIDTEFTPIIANNGSNQYYVDCQSIAGGNNGGGNSQGNSYFSFYIQGVAHTLDSPTTVATPVYTPNSFKEGYIYIMANSYHNVPNE